MASLVIQNKGTEVTAYLTDDPQANNQDQKTQEVAQIVLTSVAPNPVTIRAGNVTLQVPRDCPLGAAALASPAASPTPSDSDTESDAINLFEDEGIDDNMKDLDIEALTEEEEAQINAADDDYICENFKKNEVLAKIALQREDTKLFKHAFAHMKNEDAEELRDFLKECAKIADDYVD
jgi:hypothetical protein